MQIPTVKIKSGDGYAVINAEDFDPKTHTAVDEAPKSDVPDRDAIATMPKGEVRDWLEAHGADVPKGATVDEMRAALVETMFVGD